MKTSEQNDLETENLITSLFLTLRDPKADLRTFYDVELKLLEHVVKCEKKIRELEQKRRKLGLQRRGFVKQKPMTGKSKKCLMAIHEKEGILRQSVESFRRRRILLKRLVDALAWILTRFNRAYIRSMGRKEPTGFIVGKAGYKLERLALEATFNEEKQTIGILHDVTNCLRVGDVTVVQLEGSPTILGCLELKLVRDKLAPKHSREKRQKEHGEIIWEYLSTGKSTQILPGFTVISSRPKLENHWSEMRYLLRKAKSRGYAYEKIEDALLYVAYNPQIIEIEEIIEKLENELDPPFDFGCLDRHREGLFDHEPIFTFEIDPELILDILFGRLVLCIFLSFGKLKPLIKDLGYDLVLPSDLGGSKKGLKLVSGNGEEIFIGSYPIEMLLYEGLSIKSFLSVINGLKKIRVENVKKSSRSKFK